MEQSDQVTFNTMKLHLLVPRNNYPPVVPLPSAPFALIIPPSCQQAAVCLRPTNQLPTLVFK
ncbi:predicted protein [Plenodomus lingam JN3]|uniref:Predicted protein n=1 Tax=Leptosphaeria maculans (strain JN3 / isolate v23.1.3 / race Av1-4-5-6-7-8) TaxID=985895 RepID=E4ZWQ8_LEPMJ|nr:predicted protein [Plenodomus lingam JN3]CBX96034.1 predicted protein [Plenodomus lingam JN3]